MAKQVPVTFETAFEDNTILPIHLARIQIGEFIGRLVLFPDGQTRLLIPKEALDKRYVIVGPDIPPGTIFGF